MDVFSDQNLYQKLLDSSFRFLSFRPRSEKEFRDFLAKKLSRSSVIPAKLVPDFDRGAGIQSSLVDRVVDRLRDLGYLDDAKFVAWWVEQRELHNPKGARLIAQELKAKGISDDLVKPLLVKRRGQFHCGRNEIDPDTEFALAKRALEKKLTVWQGLSKLDLKKKIYGFLGRRGFDGETIHRVIDVGVRGEVE